MKVRSVFLSVVVSLVMSLWGAQGLLAGEEKPLAPDEHPEAVPEGDRPTASAAVALLSQYIWRGYELSKDSLVIEPSVTVGYKGFSMNIWGNWDTDVYAGPNEGRSKWNETDFTLAYDTSFDIVNLGVGYIWYSLDSAKDYGEGYLAVGLSTLLKPTFKIYRGFGVGSGWYMALQVSHSFSLPYEMSLDLAGSGAYYVSDNDTVVEYDGNGDPTTKRFSDFQDGLLSVGLTIPFAKYFKVQPMVAYSFALSQKADRLLRYTSLSDTSNHLYGGVILSMSF